MALTATSTSWIARLNSRGIPLFTALSLVNLVRDTNGSLPPVTRWVRVRGPDERQQPSQSGTVCNLLIMALRKTWSWAPMPSIERMALGSASVIALTACPTQSVPARVDKTN